MDNVRKVESIETLIYYTAFDEGIIPRSFDPFTPLTRGVALEFMVQEYQLNLELKEEGSIFRDITEGHPLYDMVQAAHKRSWFDRSNMTRLEPDKPLFRSLFATWFIGSLGAANPFLDTPAFNTVGLKLDRLYDDVYHRETIDLNKASAGELNTGFEDMTEAELALRARTLREDYRKKLTFEPSRLTLEMLDELERGLDRERIYQRQDFDSNTN